MDIARNHTATHLLHKALKDVLGSHVNQAGSLVAPDRLRFDFTHFEAISSEDLRRIENIVNDKIMESLEVETIETTIDEARRMGATALFDEKYADIVRVVKAGEYSMELCGGTHVLNTAIIGLFKIISEGGVAAGVRRIEAVTGKGALKYIESLENMLRDVALRLKSNVKDVPRRTEILLQDLKEKEREIEALKSKIAKDAAMNLVNDAKDVKGVKVITASFDLDVDALRELGDKLKERLETCLVVLASTKDDKVSFVAMATTDAVSKGVHAGNIIREVAKVAGGGGGGRPDMAQAGGKDKSKVNEALDTVYKLVEDIVK